MMIFSGNLYFDVLAIIVSSLAIAVGYFKWSFTFWKRKGVYTLFPTIPFGNAANLVFRTGSLGTDLKRNYDEFKKKGLKYGGYYFFTKPIFIPVDLDLIKAMLTKDFVHFTDRAIFTDSKIEPLTDHIIFQKGLSWRKIRTKMDPSFTPCKIRMMFQTVLDCSKGLTDIVDNAAKKKESVDVKEVISRFLIDVLGFCAFGIDCNSLKNPNAEFRKCGKRFFDTSLWSCFVRLLSIMTPELLHYINFRTVSKHVTDFFTNVVKETVDYREKNNILQSDVLDLLMQSKSNAKLRHIGIKKFNKMTSTIDDGTLNKDTQEASLTLREITAQCFGIFIAGFETSTITTSYCLYEIANSSEIQNKLRNEINTVLTRHEGKITYDSMMEMTYLDQCYNESLRKHPPVPMHTRQCTKTYHVPNSDVIIEEGTFALIPAFAIHRDPEFFPDPEKFNPERFSEEGKTSMRPTSWIPFSDGPRMCLGLRLAEMQVKVGLITLLKDYKFKVNSKTPSPLGIDPKMIFITTPNGEIWVDVEKIG